MIRVSTIVFVFIVLGFISLDSNKAKIALENKPTFSLQPLVAEKMYSAFDCVQLASLDIQAVKTLNDPDLDPHYIRYLALYNYPKEKRKLLKKASDYVINSLNTKYLNIKRTALIPADTDDTLVIRVNLKDYGIDPKAWDDLAELGSGRVPLPDPYFHYRLEAFEENKQEFEIKKVKKEIEVIDHLGRRIKKEIEVEEKIPKPSTVKIKRFALAQAPWLIIPDNGVALTNLVNYTYTKNPILRADWFLTYASWSPAYYALIGIKGKPERIDGVLKIKNGENEFEALAQFDAIKSKQALITSITDTKIVALNNRIISRRPTVAGYLGGAYWASGDTNTGLDDEDYMNNLIKFDNPKIKAKEIIASVANQMHIYAVTDNQRNLVLFADPQIAIHGDQMPTRIQDKIVYAGLRNCALCHNEGIVTIRDKVRSLAQGKIALFINNLVNNKIDHELSKRIQQTFYPDIKPIQLHDNALFQATLLACNELTPLQNKAIFEDFIITYFDEFVTIDKVALEVGTPKETLLDLLKKEQNLDHTVVSLLQDAPLDISRLQWENQGHSVLMKVLLKYLRR